MIPMIQALAISVFEFSAREYKILPKTEKIRRFTFFEIG